MYKKIQIVVLLSAVSGYMLNGMETPVGKQIGERAAASITPTQQEGAQEFMKQFLEQFQGAAAQDVTDMPVQATTPLPDITGIEEQTAQTLAAAAPTATPSPDAEVAPGIFSSMLEKLSAAQEGIRTGAQEKLSAAQEGLFTKLSEAQEGISARLPAAPSLEQAKGMLPTLPAFKDIRGKLPDLSSVKGMSARLPAVPSMATVTQALKENPTLAAGAILGSVALGGYMMRNYLKRQAKSNESEVFYTAVQNSLNILENTKSTALKESKSQLAANINALDTLQTYYTNSPTTANQINDVINGLKIAANIKPESPDKAFFIKQIITKADAALALLSSHKIDTLYNFTLIDDISAIFEL